MIVGAMSTKNKKKIRCFIEMKQLQQIEQEAKDRRISKSAVIREKLSLGFKEIQYGK